MLLHQALFLPGVLSGRPAPKPEPEPVSPDGPITGAAAPEEFDVPREAQYVRLLLSVSSDICRDDLTAELHEYSEGGRLLWRDTVRCVTPAMDRVPLQIPANVLTADREYTIIVYSKRQAINLYSFRVRSR